MENVNLISPFVMICVSLLGTGFLNQIFRVSMSYEGTVFRDSRLSTLFHDPARIPVISYHSSAVVVLFHVECLSSKCGMK